jgi:hypothetical protein
MRGCVQRCAGCGDGGNVAALGICGRVREGGGVELASLVFFGQKLQRGVECAGDTRRRVEYEDGFGAVGCVGGCFGECEKLLVAPSRGLMAALREWEEGRLSLFRTYPEERFAGRHCVWMCLEAQLGRGELR